MIKGAWCKNMWQREFGKTGLGGIQRGRIYFGDNGVSSYYS